MEKSLLIPNNFQEKYKLPSNCTNVEIKKSFEVIKYLRKLVFELTSIKNINEYFIGLLFTTLQQIQFSSVEGLTRSQNKTRLKFAFISAALIYEKLLNEGVLNFTNKDARNTQTTLSIENDPNKAGNISDKSQALNFADVLLVIVTEVEANAIFNAIERKFGYIPRAHFLGNNAYYDLGIIGGAKTVMVRSEMGSGGPSGSILTVAEAVNQLSPSAIIMVGIAFGVDQKKQSIGDVLVSKQVMAYEFQRIGTRADGKDSIIPRGDRVSASPRLLGRFRDGEVIWKDANIEFGLILSGEKLVDNLSFLNYLLKLEPEAIGGEMEGAGLYNVAYRNKIDWIIVKGICDWAEGKKHINKTERQLKAAQNAVSLTINVLERGGFNVGNSNRLSK